MTMLSDRSIRQAVATNHLRIAPFRDEQVQPASYDLRVDLQEPLTLEPGKLILLSTLETVGLPPDLAGKVDGRSSLGRLGVLVTVTAGFIDPGFYGQITLEVYALGGPVTLEPGDRIAQICFWRLDQPAEKPYRGRYQGQVGATESRFRHGDE